MQLYLKAIIEGLKDSGKRRRTNWPAIKDGA